VAWATRTEQNRNKRSNHLLTFRGETLCMAEWAERVGIKRSTVDDRLREGWTVERALATPARRMAKKATTMPQCHSEPPKNQPPL
jgi:hypothetical protein